MGGGAWRGIATAHTSPRPPACPPRYAGWVDCALQSYREQGARVFFRGLNATLSRAFLTNGAIFTTYELSHKALTALP